MIDQKIEKNCTGCFACENICALNAISLMPDCEGFVYPKVNYEKCVKCGRCVTRCPSLNPEKREQYFEPDVYAAWHTDQTIRIESTSGGVFSALAEAILRRGGYVVGAYYDENFQIRHTVIDSLEKLPLLRQSKYAQSHMGLTFREVKKLLEQKKTVLFCGTPCQSAGLQNYLSKSYDTLFCCDFICRGVISPKVYDKFLHDMLPSGQHKLKRVHFKNKDFGWNRFSTKLTFQDGQVYHKDRNHDYYMRGYLRHNLYLRPSCHECQYKILPRTSDLSLGDFWGIGNFDPNLDNEMGTSVILVNSEKGRVLLAMAAPYLCLSRRTIEEVLSGNSCLLDAAPVGAYRDYFFKNMDRQPFGKLIEEIDQKSMKIKLTDRILQKLSAVKRKITGA